MSKLKVKPPRGTRLVIGADAIAADILKALAAAGCPTSRHDLWDKITSAKCSEHSLDEVLCWMKREARIVMVKRGVYALPEGGAR
ncbi:hypothetical protein DB346_02900 [Verrucomicrobia bacterium LW23]|nr:hypothetical protein DB346_03755 [Verrucomicrobia bacterium LW23]PTY04397.1 hypothetical protein DB346_02900 [Verrucomicrobia bacterium LW23]